MLVSAVQQSESVIHISPLPHQSSEQGSLCYTAGSHQLSVLYMLLLLLSHFSHVRLLATPWTAAYQAPPSVGFFQARVLVWGAIEQRHRAAKNKIISFKNRIHLSPSIQVLNILERF